MKTAACFLLGLLPLTFVAPLSAAERYEARFRDGKTKSHDELKELFSHEKTQQLGSMTLFDAGNPVRQLRNLRGRVRVIGACVELANGDVLPGRITAYLPTEAGLPGRFVVALDETEREGTFDVSQFTVREGQVRRILGSPLSGGEFTPGRITLHDGRRVVGRSFRFQASQIQALTKEGVVNAPWSEIARADFPGVDPTAALLHDRVFTNDPSSVVRVRLKNGAEISFARPLAFRGDQRWFLARPSWSLDPIQIFYDAVSVYTFCDADELPLSLLPVVEERRGKSLQERGLQRNRDADGGVLRVGQLTADLGLAMHAYHAAVFALPSGAKTIDGLVGVNHPAGAGCVKCRIVKGDIDGGPCWESNFLRGGDAPAEFKGVDISGANKLALVVEPAHEGRPAGADPLNIRDDAVWLGPTIRIDAAARSKPAAEAPFWLPALVGWETNEAELARRVLRPVFERGRGSCPIALVDAPESNEAAPLKLRKTIQVTPQNGRLFIEAGRDGKGKVGHVIKVQIGDDKIEPSLGNAFKTAAASPAKNDRREFSLGEYLGREVTLEITATPESQNARDVCGLILQAIAFKPLIENLAADGVIAEPEVSLSQLKPTETKVNGQPKPLELVTGKSAAGKLLTIRKIPFATGIAIPVNGEVTYALEERYARFTAIIGLADGGTGAGPFELLLDGEPFWKDDGGEMYGRLSAARKIDVALPAGHQTITLKVRGNDGEGAWGAAGFSTAK